MKKVTLLITVLMIFSFASASAFVKSDELVFRPQRGGYFIYENNVESIRREDLSDTSNKNPTYIMKNPSLHKSKYSVFITNLNYTGVKDKDNNIIEKGFDIEVDAVFEAETDCKIKITSLGFEMPDVKSLYQKGHEEKYEETWSCLEAWATYLKMPIKQIDSHKIYENLPFEETTFSLKKGEKKWISEFIENYDKIPYLKPVNILMDFEVLSGETEFNIAALKHNGILKDRSHHNYNAHSGTFYRERQYKGVADTLPKTSATLRYTITDKAENGDRLPVVLYNQYHKNGIKTDEWVTNLNPQNDKWSYDICAESDMISLKYKDPSKVNLYGENVKKPARDDVWYFDVFHADNTDMDENLSEKEKLNYVPNKLVSVKEENYLSACNLGNYGVRVNYKMEIYNNTKQAKYAYYKLATGSNNIVILYDENGKMINDYALCKGVKEDGTEDVMACVELLPSKETVFYLDVILPANCNGGMLNYFEIYDTPYEIKFSDTDLEFVKNGYTNDGEKFLKFENGKLFASYDLKEYFEINLPQSAKDIFGVEGENFDILKTKDGYVAKWSAYDGAPFYFNQVLDFYSTIYLFDDDFNLIKEQKFDEFPTDIKYNDDVYYVTAGKTYYSNDFKTFNELTTINVPKTNKKFDVASTKYGYFFIATKDLPYVKLTHTDKIPKYINSFNDIFYYTDKNTLYLSNNAVYWEKYEFDEDIKYIDRVLDDIVINKDKKIEIPKFDRDIILKLQDEIIALKNKPFDIDGVIMIPINDVFANADITLRWDNEYKNALIQKMYTNAKVKVDETIAIVNDKEFEMKEKAQIVNDELYVSLDFLTEVLGFDVNYYFDGNILELGW